MSITQVGSLSSDAGAPGGGTFTLTYPAGLASGDIIIVVVEHRGGSSSSITPATGFTSLLRTNSSTSTAIEAFKKVSDGTETGATANWTMTNANSHSAFLGAWTGVDGTTPVNTQAGGTATSGTTSVVAPTLTTTVGSCLLLRCHGARLNSTTQVSYTADAATSEISDHESGAVNPNLSLMIATETAGAAGAVGTRTATASATITDCASMTIAIAPAAAATTEARRHMPRGVNRGVARGVSTG